MIPVLGCETARELLEPFVDGELGISDQVAVQAHLRTCNTCQARVADMSLIGWSLRMAPLPASPEADASALAVVQSEVLTRVRAEREQALATRAAELFADMRLLWPALGATAAVMLCLVLAGNIWRLTMERRPNSMAALLDTWGMPGTDQNPLLLDNAVSLPQVLGDGMAYYGVPESERSVTVRAVVTMSGKIGQAEVVDADYDMPRAQAGQAADGRDVLNAVLNWQLRPAQSRGGRPVAVTVVYMYWQTTAVKETVQALESAPASRVIRPVVPVSKPLPAPVGVQSALPGVSAAV